MAVAQKLLNAFQTLRYAAAAIVFSIVVSGCAVSQLPNQSENKTAVRTLAPISLVSSQEEQMLKDAAERAERLHRQLRELEARNVTITRRLSGAQGLNVATSDQRLASQRNRKGNQNTTPTKARVIDLPVTVSQKIEPTTKFSIEFGQGSSSLEEVERNELLSNLGLTNPAVKKIGGSKKTLFLIELSTYGKNGLDSVNRGRFKAITDVLTDVGISPEAVLLKERRLGQDASAKAKRIASRLVRITKLEATSVTS
jgi:hypothetical protein